MKLTAFALTALCGMTSAQTIVDIAAGNGNFSTLVAAVTQADLVDALSADGPLTVFAPTNQAFTDTVPAETLTMLLEDMWKTHLTGILLYHVVSGSVPSSALSQGLMADTLLEGEQLEVTSLTPVQINGVDVITPDIEASNGIIHVVDEVLLPPFMTKDVVDTASANADFSTLVDLVVAADLVEVLKDSGLTVFAPTNAAFAKLPTEELEMLKLPENKEMLVDILSYHVVPGVVVASQLKEGAMVATKLEGKKLTITLEGGAKVNGIDISMTDILTSNGVIHVVDEVIVPPEADTSSTRAISAMVGALALVSVIAL